MVTSKDLMTAGGVDRQTLAQLQRLGVIPNPLKQTAPGGRGMRGYWPQSSLEIMRTVRQLRAEGRTLDQIAARLSRTIEWGRPSARSHVLLAALDQSYRVEGRVTITDTGRGYVRGHVTDQLCDVGVALEKAERLAAAVTEDTPLGWAIELLMIGMSPVALMPASGPYVVPDFLVSHEISFARQQIRLAHPQRSLTEDVVMREGSNAARGCVVVALSLFIAEALRRGGVTGAVPNFGYLPGEKVRRAESDVIVEQEILTFQLPPGAAGTYGFTLRGAVSNVEMIQAPTDRKTPTTRQKRRPSTRGRKQKE